MNPFKFIDWEEFEKVFRGFMWFLVFLMVMAILTVASAGPSTATGNSHPVIVGR